MPDALNRILGLVHHNIYIRYSFLDGQHVSSNVELYNSKENAETHDGVTGLVGKYRLTITYDAGFIYDHTMVKLE